jgi:hypothetical protein
MKLRWLVINYPQPTVEQVKQLRAETGEGMMYCKKILTKPSEKKLQYCVNEYSEDWEDVPTVVWNV